MRDNRLERAASLLPDDVHAQLADYAEFLVAKHRPQAATAKGMTFDWAGALAGQSGGKTSVELQHEATEEMRNAD